MPRRCCNVQCGARPVEAALHAQVVVQDLEDAVSYVHLLPIAQPTPAGHAAPAAHLLRQILPGNACPENEEDAGKSLAVWNRPASVGLGPLGWQDGFDQIPEFVAENGSCHGKQTNISLLSRD